MASATLKKSVTDLTRRKARAVFAVLTLAIAVASVGIFAAPSLMNQAMQKEVQANKLPDLALSIKPLNVTPVQLATLGHLPNVSRRGRVQLLPDARLGRRASCEGACRWCARLGAPAGQCRLGRFGHGADLRRAHATSRTPSRAASRARQATRSASSVSAIAR